MHTSGEAVNGVSSQSPFVTALFANALVGMRTWRILREKADCKQSSLTDEDTCFGVSLDKGTNRPGRSLFIYLFFF